MVRKLIETRRRCVCGWLFAGLCVGLATGASAQDIPDFDVDRHCREQAKMFGDSAFLQKSCLEQEQQAYDKFRK